jgi:hypothetical protein
MGSENLIWFESRSLVDLIFSKRCRAKAMLRVLQHDYAPEKLEINKLGIAAMADEQVYATRFSEQALDDASRLPKQTP